MILLKSSRNPKSLTQNEGRNKVVVRLTLSRALDIIPLTGLEHKKEHKIKVTCQSILLKTNPYMASYSA